VLTGWNVRNEGAPWPCSKPDFDILSSHFSETYEVGIEYGVYIYVSLQILKIVRLCYVAHFNGRSKLRRWRRCRPLAVWEPRIFHPVLKSIPRSSPPFWSVCFGKCPLGLMLSLFDPCACAFCRLYVCSFVVDGLARSETLWECSKSSVRT